MEPAVGERQPGDVETKLALAGEAVPAELRRGLRGAAEHEATVVAKLEVTSGARDAGVRRDDDTHGDRLARGELRPLLARSIEQLRRLDPRLTAAPLAQARLELLRARVGGEQPPVGGDRLLRRAVERNLALTEQHRSLTQAFDGLRVVRDEDDRAAAVLELGDLAEALALELLVADGEHLVEQQHVGANVRGDGEPQTHVHPRRVRTHRQVDELLELGERDDLVHRLADRRPRQAVDRAVQIDVLTAGEIRVEPGPELEQRRNAAAGLDPPAVGLMIPETMRNRVDLPEPFRPTRPTASPGSIVSETSCSACTSRAPSRPRATNTSFSVRCAFG